MEQPIIQLNQITAGYAHKNAIHNISLSVQKGEILCIVGESGSGKSTLLKTIMGVPEMNISLQEGSIYFAGKELHQLTSKERALYMGNKIGMIFQNPSTFFNPIRKYKKQFKETLKCHGKYDRATFYEKAERIFISLHLHEFHRIFESCPCELSGGMNQRIAIAMVMMLEPALLLADEPTSALDPTVQRQVIEELINLRDRCGMSIIMVTHSMGVARKMADQIAIMYQGEIVEYDDANKVINAPQHPYAKALLKAEPQFPAEIVEAIQASFKQNYKKIEDPFCDYCLTQNSEGGEGNE